MALDEAGLRLVAEDSNKFFGDMRRAEGAVNSFVDTTEKAGGRVSAFGEMVTGGLRRAGEAVVNFGFEAGKALLSFAGDSIGVAGDFEAGMNRFGAAAGDALEEAEIPLEDFRDLFMDIGKELPVSTAEVQDAAIALVKGGLDPAILAAGGLKDAIQFAAAAELDLAFAAELGVKQLGVWVSATASAEEQTRFLAMSQDLLVKAAGASTLNVDNLAAAMNVAGGQAKALDLDYRDFVTGITLISPAFNSAQEAGTGFKNFLARIQPSTNPAKDAMFELGLWTKETGSAFFDASGEYVGNAQAAELLKQATAGLTDAKKAELLQTIFGNDAMGAAVALASSGAEGYTILAEKIDQASGVSATAAAKQEGYNNALSNAQGSIEVLQLTIGGYLIPTLTTLLNDHITPGINAFVDFTDRIFATSDPVAALVAEIDKLIPGFAGVVEFGGRAVGAIQGVVLAFQSTGNEGSELGAVLNDLQVIWDNLWVAVQMVAAGYQSYVLAVFGQVQTFLDTHGEEIQQFIADAWERIRGIINVALPLISGIIIGTFLYIRDFINEHGEEIQRILSNAWTIISNVVLGALEIIEGILKAALAVFQGDWEGAWEAIRTMSEGVVKRIWEVIKAALDLIAMLFGTSLDEILRTWQYNLEQLPKVALAFGRQLYDAGSALIGNLWEGMEQKWEEFESWLRAQWEGITDILPGSEPKDPSSPLRGLSDRGAAFIMNILDGMRDALPDLLGFVSDMGEDLVENIKDATDQISDVIADALGGQASFARQQADNMAQMEGLREDLDPTTFAVLQSSLNRALEESKQFTDPQQATDYYDLLSKHAFELADIRAQIAETEDHDAKMRLFDQMRLIEQAQETEIAAFKERASTQDNPMQAIFDQISAMIQSLTIEGNMPASLMALMEQLVQLGNFMGGQAPVTPAASGQQMAGTTNNYYGQVGSNYSMPVQTNNSPAALFQSYQALRAAAGWGT
jgi:TP901 family phage tail tape measure protein